MFDWTGLAATIAAAGALVQTLRNGRATSDVKKSVVDVKSSVADVHTLVNDRSEKQDNRIEQLSTAITDAGGNVPARPAAGEVVDP